MQDHKAGFVSIIGKPNVGKSTLTNALVGDTLSIITSKAQTTRHRIFGILNGEDFQIVYSDTPGIIDPQYELHKSMMRFVSSSLEDADVILYMVSLEDKLSDDEEIIERLKKLDVPVVFIINKVDLAKGSQVKDKIDYWKGIVDFADLIEISALEGENIDKVFAAIMERLPVHPPYFPKDTFTDKSERFFASEIIREKIFLNYSQEVPYSCEVEVTEFVDEGHILRIRCEIYVERASQKAIIIGKRGDAIKKVGTEARLDMEKFFGKKIFLEQFVKVEKDWRTNKLKLGKFGYN